MAEIAGEPAPEYKDEPSKLAQDRSVPGDNINDDPQSLLDKSLPAADQERVQSSQKKQTLENESSIPENKKSAEHTESGKTKLTVKEMIVASYQILKVAYEGSIKSVGTRVAITLPHAALGAAVGGLTGILIDAVSNKTDAFISDPKTALGVFLGVTILYGIFTKAEQLAAEKFDSIKKQKIDIFMRNGLTAQQLDVLVSQNFQQKLGGIRSEMWRVYQFASKPMEALSNTTRLLVSISLVGFFGKEALLPVVLGGLAKSVSAFLDLSDFHKMHARLKQKHHLSDAVWRTYFEPSALVEMVVTKKQDKVSGLGQVVEREIVAERDKYRLMSAKRSMIAELVNYGSMGVALFTCITQVQAGTMSIGELTAVIAAISQFTGATTGLIENSIGQLNNISIVKELLDICRKPEAMKRSHELNAKIKKQLIDYLGAPEINFNKVSFAYPKEQKNQDSETTEDDKKNNQPDEPPFKIQNISLSIAPGKIIGLAGTNGSGKSTLINIIIGLIKPEGEVTINGIAIQSLDVQAEWLPRVGILTQEHHLFTGLSIKDQIVSEILEEPADENQPFKVEELAKVAVFSEQLHKRVDDNSLIGEGLRNGFKPSGGQKQKIALARALESRPDVLILDEPTASLDSSAAKALLPNLRQFFEENNYHPTVLVVTHKMDIFPLCDQVIVMDNGEIKGQGSHDVLMKNEGSVYRQLFNDYKN